MKEQVTANEINPVPCFVPGTHKGKGRRISVAPGKTAARYLHYGRITLAAADTPLSFNNSDNGTGLVCLNGAAKVSTAGQTFNSRATMRSMFRATHSRSESE